MRIRRIFILILLVLITFLLGCNNTKEVEVTNPIHDLSSSNEISTNSNSSNSSETRQIDIKSNDSNVANVDPLIGSHQENTYKTGKRILVSKDEQYIYYLELEPEPIIVEFSPDDSVELSRYGAFEYKDNLIFNTFVSIYKCNKDGSNIQNLFTREYSGAGFEITKIEDEWIYFETLSEDGLSESRVTINGDKCEDLGTTSLED